MHNESSEIHPIDPKREHESVCAQKSLCANGVTFNRYQNQNISKYTTSEN